MKTKHAPFAVAFFALSVAAGALAVSALMPAPASAQARNDDTDRYIKRLNGSGITVGTIFSYGTTVNGCTPGDGGGFTLVKGEMYRLISPDAGAVYLATTDGGGVVTTTTGGPLPTGWPGEIVTLWNNEQCIAVLGPDPTRVDVKLMR